MTLQRNRAVKGIMFRMISRYVFSSEECWVFDVVDEVDMCVLYSLAGWWRRLPLISECSSCGRCTRSCKNIPSLITSRYDVPKP
jgi:hypothetical protein